MSKVNDSVVLKLFSVPFNLRKNEDEEALKNTRESIKKFRIDKTKLLNEQKVNENQINFIYNDKNKKLTKNQSEKLLPLLRKRKKLINDILSIDKKIDILEKSIQNHKKVDDHVSITKNIENMNKATNNLKKDIDIEKYNDVLDELNENDLEINEFSEALDESDKKLNDNIIDDDQLLKDFLEEDDIVINLKQSQNDIKINNNNKNNYDYDKDEEYYDIDLENLPKVEKDRDLKELNKIKIPVKSYQFNINNVYDKNENKYW